MKKILVIGASGFLGGYLARELLGNGYFVRALARDTSRLTDLAAKGCEIVQGDISDFASMERALDGVDAAYISVHTLSPQPASPARADFMDVEMNGLENIVQGCKSKDVSRLLYVTFLGIAPDAPSAWIRGRWKAEQFLLASGLDVTVIRPGQIVGVGGFGFNTMVSHAKRPVSVNLFGAGRQKFRNIDVGDLVYYLAGALEDSRTYGQCYDVGNDDVLTNNEMIDVAAAVMGRRPPIKIDLPRGLLGSLAPFIERAAKLPRGALRGLADTVLTDSIGDPTPLRMILPRVPLSYRAAVERALRSTEKNERHASRR